MQSHTWLVVTELIIDVTGDQFKYYEAPLTCNLPVYIGPMTEYYKLFEITSGSQYEHLGFNEQWLNYQELKDWYETILNYIQ